MFLFFTNCSGKRPILGVKDGILLPCPSSPNCVQSMHKGDTDHWIEPLTLLSSATRNLQDSKKNLEEIIRTTPRTNFITKDENYWHVEYTSFLFRFVDDVEFLFQDQIVHVRSASRIGYGDHGVNRNRIEDIRTKLGQL